MIVFLFLRTYFRYNGITTVNILFQSGILHALPDLITCPDLDVAYRALDLVVNLTSFRTQQVQSTPWYTLIPGTLGKFQLNAANVPIPWNESIGQFDVLKGTLPSDDLMNHQNTDLVQETESAVNILE